MTRNVVTLSPAATIMEAAERMKAFNVGAIPVCEGDRILGMLTDRDIAIRVVAEDRNPQETKIGDVMTWDAFSSHDDVDVDEAAKLMQQKQIRRLPVVDRNQRIVGMLSLDDLAARAGDRWLSGQTLEEVAAEPEPGK